MTWPLPHRYCQDDMLTVTQLCQRLPETTPGMVYRWSGCPRYRTGKRNLYMWGEVLAYLRDRPATSRREGGVVRASVAAAGRVGEVFSMPHRSGSLSTPSRGTFTTHQPPPPTPHTPGQGQPDDETPPPAAQR